MQKTILQPVKPPILSKQSLERIRAIITPIRATQVPSYDDNTKRNIQILDPISASVYGLVSLFLLIRF